MWAPRGVAVAMRASFLRVMGKEKRGRESTDERAANEGDALRESQLGCLPKHIFADVVSRLDGADVARLGATCRAARALCSRPSIWRALARAQEPPALVREDLVNRDFTWKQLYAWRRHVLAHRARGVNRIAVADSARVLTCDPVEGGGASWSRTRRPRRSRSTRTSSPGPRAGRCSRSHRRARRDVASSSPRRRSRSDRREGGIRS